MAMAKAVLLDHTDPSVLVPFSEGRNSDSFSISGNRIKLKLYAADIDTRKPRSLPIHFHNITSEQCNGRAFQSP